MDALDPIHLVVIGDIGGRDEFHLGDEAMLEANLASFRSLLPRARFTLVSRDPDWTSRRYAAASIRGEGAEARDALLASDGLVVSGGGNLCSRWPRHVAQRARFLTLAASLGKPSVVLGQTIGPTLEAQERRLLGDALPSAAYVGTRDLPSTALALGLGVPPERVFYQLDDAFDLAESPLEGRRLEASGLPEGPFAAVTVDPSSALAREPDALESFAGQLGAFAREAGLAVALLPHVTSVHDVTTSDLVPALRLEETLSGVPVGLVTEVWEPREVRWVTGHASVVLSTRYHPLVFACAAGVPSVGIYGDEYTRVKLQGALAHADLEGWTLSTDEARRGGLLDKARALWAERERVHTDLLGRRPAWRRSEERRWGSVCAALGVKGPDVPPGEGLSERIGVLGALRALDKQHRAFEALREGWTVRFEDLRRYTRSLEETVAREREESAAERVRMMTRFEEVEAYALSLEAERREASSPPKKKEEA